MSSSTGKLLVVATPIGNLEDMTLRAIDVLRDSDLIIAEDTRRTSVLLSHFGIDTPLKSYHGDSIKSVRTGLIERISSGLTAALLTDAGTPGISDPGAEFVAEAVSVGLEVSPVPGASAITAALSVSGFNADQFVFLGYPPRKASSRADFFSKALAQTRTVLLFESPHRIIDTIAELAAIAPERAAFMGRELTKRFEELTRGTLEQMAQSIEGSEPRGEYVIILSGAPEPKQREIDPAAIAGVVKIMKEAGLRTRQITQILSTLTPLSRNEAYECALDKGRWDG